MNECNISISICVLLTCDAWPEVHSVNICEEMVVDFQGHLRVDYEDAGEHILFFMLTYSEDEFVSVKNEDVVIYT